jgi:hypothetical protein
MEIPHDPQLTRRLEKGTVHDGTDPLGGFAYKLDLSVPYIATAIHAGSGVRDELLDLMRISETDRCYEEDIATERFIRELPSTIQCLDSRTEYDVNRPPELALPLTPDMFWGVRVYHTPPSSAMNRRSMEKYEAFYRFVGSCLKILLDRFGVCIVYDIHSYNPDRQKARGIACPPVFNLGTRQLDRPGWKAPIDEWLQQLGRIEIPGVQTTVAENEVFSGLGEFCRRLTEWSPNILVLPTEISKIYMDPRKGTVYEDVVRCLQKGLKTAVFAHARSAIVYTPALNPAKRQSRTI